MCSLSNCCFSHIEKRKLNGTSEQPKLPWEIMDHWISELISALIAAMGQFCCVFKIRHVAFLPWCHKTQR